MSALDRGQVNRNAAEVYEEFFIPALFAEWPDRVAAAAHVQPGHSVLDVGCGTGILARTAAAHAGRTGAVVGIDVNDGMLAVAQRKAPYIDWKQGQAESLPFENSRFDVVVSQFALMFFDDRRTALREMMRVLRPGGRLAVAVWSSLDDTPGYAAMVSLLQRLFGDQAANALRAPYALGDKQELHSLFRDAGIADAGIATHPGTARFPSIRSWVYTDIKGWVLADAFDDDKLSVLVAEAEQELQRFVNGDGTVAFDAPAHIVAASKPS